MAIDFNLPVVGTLYTSVLTYIRDNIIAIAKMDFTAASNIPTGALRLNSTFNRFEKYDGADWDDELDLLADNDADSTVGFGARDDDWRVNIASADMFIVDLDGIKGTKIKDENDMASAEGAGGVFNLCTQQSIKAYADAAAAAAVAAIDYSATYITTLGLNDGTYNIALPTNNPGAAKFMLGNSSTILWMYLNVAPPGWKALATGADTVLGVSGGAAAYNINGGTAGGTFDHTHADTLAAPAHTHTGPSHTHNTTIPENGWGVGSQGVGGRVSSGPDISRTSERTIASASDGTGVTGGASDTALSGSVTSTSNYRPSASVGKLFQLDTA